MKIDAKTPSGKTKCGKLDKIEKKAFYYNVKIIKSFTSDELSDAIGSNNNKVLGILVTHYHPDHVGALDELKEVYDVPVYNYKTVDKM